jgi:hypothetical protein
MDHQLQKLARLGLEFERFDPRVHRIPFKMTYPETRPAPAVKPQRRATARRAYPRGAGPTMGGEASTHPAAGGGVRVRCAGAARTSKFIDRSPPDADHIRGLFDWRQPE